MIFPKVQFVQSTEGKMSILSRSIYTIFFTVGSRNSTKISNFKNLMELVFALTTQ
jgi:hypothetical protein